MRDELADAERLHDVVVGPELKPTHPVVLAGSRGEDQHRHIRPAAQLAQQVESIPRPKHQINERGIRLLPLEDLERGRWVLGRERSEACLLHDLREKTKKLAVVDDQKLATKLP